MRVACPKCNSEMTDPNGGGILTKCPKCGFDGDDALEASYQKNEYEINNHDEPPIHSWERNEES